MGNGKSKLDPSQLDGLEEKIKGLVTDIQSIQSNVQGLSKEFLMKSELDSKIQCVEEDTTAASEKLNQLLEITRDQQQVIIELGAQYSQLYNSYQCQQEAIELITTKCDERLSRYEEELQIAKAKLGEIEKGVIENSEFAKVIGIRKTDNMIKKEAISPLRKKNVSSVTNVVALKQSVDEKVKGRERNQIIKSQKKNEKELTPDTVKTSSRYKENDVPVEQENKLNFLELIMNEKRDFNTQPKESLAEVDLNTLL